MRKSTGLCFILLLFSQILAAQTVPFPSGNRDYEAISPWGYTNAGTTWDTSPYLPFIYRDMWFRFMPPNGVTYNTSTNTWNYGADPNKKYPLILFFQGAGETGSDNNKQLTHGGRVHRDAVLSGAFPGFLLYPQSVDATKAKSLIDKLLATHPIDINRIYVHGLSNGAKWTWDFVQQNPTLVAAMSPCSGLSNTPEDTNLLFTPIRQAQGGRDTNPAPAWTADVVEWYNTNGGQMEYYYWPNLGHGTWNTMYALPEWFPWFLAQKKNKIYALFKKTEFCPGSPVSATLGFTPGFDAYEWRKDGVLMSATTHKITVTTYGSYTGRIRNRGVWSDWSDPVVVGDKAPTQTPPIQLTQLQSKYIPDVNGNSSVGLTLPAGFETYSWNKSGVTEPIGVTQSITVTSTGSYTGTVREVGGCSSLPSEAFSILDANGPNKPDPASNLQVASVSKTQLRLTWENTLTPTVNETGFEIYRSSTSGGPYTLLAITAPDVLLYDDPNLPSNARYYYKVRAISATAAAAATAEASGITDVDVTPPTAPNNLAVTSIGSTSVALSWSASTDDVGVAGYDVYVRQSGQTNYIKAYTTTATSQTVFGLSTGVLYNFIVKARDAADNTSSPSAMAVAATVFSGLYYSYYQGSWTSLPNFDNLTPVSTGTVSNFSLSPATATDNFGFRYTGTLYVPANNQYTFYLASDDGSKLWINNTLVVDNDGTHGTSPERNGRITLTTGYYPIKVEYFDATGSHGLTVRWSSANISKQTIPNANLKENFTMPAAPAAPTGLSMTVVDYKTLRVNWANYTGTGTDIEVYRSTNNSTWSIIATVPKTSGNSYTNTNLAASTRYYYRLRAINSGNVSSYTSSVNATTSALPPLPLAPSNLAISAVGPNTATLAWTDNSNNEESFDVYKSAENNGAYTLVASLPANTTEYVDNGLFAHTTYYFKVLSKNVRGASAYSNEVQGVTLNNSPVLSGLHNVVLRFDDVVSIPLSAADPDNDFIVIGGSSLPEFVQLFDYGDGTAVLEIEPTQADMGVYNGLEIFAEDVYGGKHTLTFNVDVNSNHNPVIADLSPLTVKETFTAQVTATATDGDNDALTWSLQDVPSFMSSTINGNSIELNFHPGTLDAGIYNISLTVTDPSGGTNTKILPLTVENYDPNFNVKVNFRTEAVANGPADWNNIGPAVSTTALNRENGTASGISLTLVNAWSGWRDGYGVTPGVYPNAVNGSYIYFYVSEGAHTLRFNGLNPNGKFNLKFLASNSIADGASRLTTFTIGGQAQSIQANTNASTLVTFSGLTSTAAGELTVSVTGPAGGYAVLNAMVLESFFDGNVVPDAPTALAATVAPSTSLIQLNWTDNASNEASYEVYRSTDNSTFTKLATLPLDASSYTDAAFTAGTTYYYKVRAINGIGGSAYSNTASLVGPNRAPVIAPISPYTMAELDYRWVLVQATDPDGDDMEFSLENEPPFVWTEYVENGQTNLTFSPNQGDAGNYEFLIRCTDALGNSSTAPVTLTVTGSGETVVKVNFTTAASLAAAPWNNVTGYTSGTVVNNLVNQNNASTTISMTVQTTFTGQNTNGYVTGNNSGVYPDAVMANSFYIQDDVTRNILVTGLKPEKAYDFTFFASRAGVTDVRNTIYAIGAKSAILNASGNTSTLATVSNVKSNASGQLTISITRQAGSAFGYVNSMVIREYDAVVVPTVPAAPANLTSQTLTRSSIKLLWQDASDNETGFQIWRSVTTSGNYALLTTLGANVTTFTDAGLSVSTPYFYKVRAVNAVGNSAYSNETSASTFDFSVSINYNSFNGGPSNWTNFPSVLPDGYVASNLIDELGNNTGISMTVVQAFTGENRFGMVTGNNSGIVPDNVMEGSFYLDPGATAILRFGNLSFLRQYNFSFFGSRNGGGDRTTVYTINGTSVSLNASMNTMNIVQIKDVLPDENGRVTVTISNTPSALYGYLNGLIIQAVPNTSGGTGGGALAETTGDGNSMKAYPNPFVDRVSVNVGQDASPKFHVSLVNTAGITVHDVYMDRSPDREELEVMFGNDLTQGVYTLRVVGNSGKSQSLRLFKR